ncbi:blue copper protein-like [Cryptomeria japonica]|uniref:blue copper protein-like n=1 Tax=Cryptomeria japonica TaxID=3369 RepID=UPI0027DA9ECD|nr:blue copper protein-like [Cryptomeria japonica]
MNFCTGIDPFMKINARFIVQTVLNGSSFANCVKEPIASGLKLESGHDKLEIEKSGNIWFICGVGQHCENAMKFKITVTDESSSSPAPAPAPESSDWSGDSEENWPTAALSSNFF